MPFKPLLREAVVQPEDNSIRLIPLTQGKVALVDADEYADVSRFNWQALYSPTSKTWYAVRWVTEQKKRRSLLMHRYLSGAPKGLDVDHVNHNGLDNRSENLRVCTRSENLANSRSHCRRFKGVHRMDGCAGFYCTVTKEGKAHYRYGFPTEELAAEAHAELSKELFGEFSCAVSTIRA